MFIIFLDLFSYPKSKQTLFYCTHSPSTLLLSATGTKHHPPSLFSFSQPAEYHERLQRDLERLVNDGSGRVSSPKWAVRVAHQSNHSGQSPLFVQQLLAASRVRCSLGDFYCELLVSNLLVGYSSLSYSWISYLWVFYWWASLVCNTCK